MRRAGDRPDHVSRRDQRWSEPSSGSRLYWAEEVFLTAGEARCPVYWSSGRGPVPESAREGQSAEPTAALPRRSRGTQPAGSSTPRRGTGGRAWSDDGVP